MKKIHKLVKNRKSNKFGTAAKILIPVAGVIAGKLLWDKKGTQAIDKARSTILDKTEDVQEKVQKFHDFLQNSVEERNEDIYEEEAVIDVEILEDDIEQAAEGEANENNEENVEETSKDEKEIITKTEESTTESESN